MINKQLSKILLVATAFIGSVAPAAISTKTIPPLGAVVFTPADKGMLRLCNTMLQKPEMVDIANQVYKSYDEGKRVIALLNEKIEGESGDAISEEVESKQTAEILEQFLAASGTDFLEVLIRQKKLYVNIVKVILSEEMRSHKGEFYLNQFLQLESVNEIASFLSKINTFASLKQLLEELVALANGLRKNLPQGEEIFKAAEKRCQGA